MLRLFLLVVLLLTQMPSQGNAGIFNPKTFTLSNGLQVIVLTNTRAPVVKQILLYKAGAIDEPLGRSGIAHFLEHLMFKGTRKYPAGQFDQIINRLGGGQNAATSRDYTYYYQEVAKEHLETILDLESDRMTNLIIDEAAIQSERDVILEERRMRTDNNPSAILGEAINAAFFQNHMYRIPVIGWEHEMEILSLKDAKDWYNNWYAPNNALLILSGDITVEEAKPLVQKYYGAIPARDLPQKINLIEPVKRGVKTHIEKRSELVQTPEYHIFYQAPTAKDDKRSTYSIEVLNHILSAGANSLLYDELVTKQKIASSVSSSYTGAWSRGPGSFYFSIQPTQNHTLAEAQDALMNMLKDLREKGITAEDVKTSIRRMVIDLEYSQDSSFAGSNLFHHYIGNGFDIDDIEHWKENIESVKVEDVNRALRDLLSQDFHLTAHLLPEKEAK